MLYWKDLKNVTNKPPLSIKLLKGGFFIKFYCPICDNCNPDYFYAIGDKFYCRKCKHYTGKLADNSYKVKKGIYKLEYELTKEQKLASEFILSNVIKNRRCAINAVCGAGKTEIIYETIQYCLNNNLKIGIAIPRKDVVIELVERLRKDFNVSVIGVYGGNTEQVEGDIIVFTTHQSFRYTRYFNVLIIDEVDAFPYSGDKILRSITEKCGSTIVYLSATMPMYIEDDETIEKFYVKRRYHGRDLPVPKCAVCFLMLSCLKRYLKKYNNKVVIVYFPTIKIQNKVSKRIKYDYLINSKTECRKDVLEKIKKMENGVVLSTTVLERGVTIKDVQVIVYNSENKLFTSDTLIQISGRVGRNKDYSEGNVVFICKNKTKHIKRAINKIKKYNE